MILSIISAVAMVIMTVSMLLRAHQVKTCRMALLPLTAGCMELFAAGFLTPVAFPWLTLLLCGLRLALLGCCGLVLQRDVAVAKAEARRKKLARRLQARTVEPMLPQMQVLPGRQHKVA
ncbi:MAG: hypothetical protein ACOYJY_01750 [Acutalibacteraceae bacterium]|jgi:hypothetical protein